MEDVLKILLYECNLRKTEEIQLMYDNCQGMIEDYIQQRVIDELKLNYTLNEYRRYIYQFSNVPEVREKVFFMKHNIMEHKTITDFADALLINPETKIATQLETLLTENATHSRPLVIISGSLT